jgi:hypothetical protein
MVSGAEVHTNSQQVMTKYFAEIVVTHLPDIRSLATETCDSTDRVGGRSTAHFYSGSKCPVQMQRPIGVDKRHRTFHQGLLVNEVVISMRDDIH